MFYIIENNEQLEDFKNIDYGKVFIEPIFYNDNVHPSLNDISLLYIKPLNKDKGYIICLDHNESLSLNKTDVSKLLHSFSEIYVRDRKKFIYFFPLTNLIDISFGIPEYTEPSTTAYDVFYSRFSSLENLNTIIPLVKHYEKCELIFDKIKDYCVKTENSKFTNKLTTTFFSIERNGLKIDKPIFDKFYEINDEAFSISDNTVYSRYNLYTTTGRPSNSFNGINFAALAKDSGCREAFIPENDYFIEIDISAYHPTLAGQLFGFDFKDETPYEYFAREAGIELSEAKILMFRQLYGGVYKEYKHIEYFKLIQEYIDDLWKSFKQHGFIECCRSGHRFTKELKDLNPNKLFNYLLQNLETSTNVVILWEIFKLLKSKHSNIVLYTYDSILIDYSKEDNILEDIKQVFTNFGLKIKLTKGKNYGTMMPLQ